jgi:hypothetical protein
MMPCSLVAGQNVHALPLLNYALSHRGVYSIKLRHVIFTKHGRSVDSVHWNKPQTKHYNMKNDIHTELTWIRVPWWGFVFMNVVNFVIWCCWFVSTSTAAYTESILLFASLPDTEWLTLFLHIDPRCHLLCSAESHNTKYSLLNLS